MHNHKRYLGGAVSSVIFFFGAMDNPSISHLIDQLPYTADTTYNRLNELKEENPNLAGKIEDIKDNIFE